MLARCHLLLCCGVSICIGGNIFQHDNPVTDSFYGMLQEQQPELAVPRESQGSFPDGRFPVV